MNEEHYITKNSSLLITADQYNKLEMSNNKKKIPVLLLLFSFESTSSVITSHWGGDVLKIEY